MAVGFDVALQNLLTQAARTAVYQQLQTVCIKVSGQQISAVNGFDGLQFGKMIAAADGADSEVV